VYEPGEDGTFYITSADKSIEEVYPVKELCNLSEIGWTASAAKSYAKRLTKLETKKEFDEFIDKAEKHGKYVSEWLISAVKQAKEPKSDSTAASLVRSHGSVVRMLSKLATVEHQAVLHCCKTARALVSVAPNA
jgi:hypothetical protein